MQGWWCRARDWALWTLPRSALAYVLLVDLAAVVAGAAAVLGQPADRRDWAVAGALFAGSVLHAEAARHIERLRTQRTDRPFIDFKGMWTFACLLLAHVGPATVLVVATFAYWWLRNDHRPPAHRWLFSAATVVLATVAAELVLPAVDRSHLLAVLAGPAGLLFVALSAVTRWLVNHGLVVGILALAAPPGAARRALTTPADTLLGLGSLALGAALAVLACASPWLVPILLVPVVVLHRGVLVDQFAQAARTDGKTGLAHGCAWAETATEELVRARRQGHRLAVLMVDIDHFKRVNDVHGHLVGDEVLRAVAETLTDDLGAHDVVGRFGGEEFVVLLRGGSRRAARTAERIRRGVHAVEVATPHGPGVLRGLTVSVGGATFPGSGGTLDDLVATADAALYRAKASGRDRTVVADRTCLPDDRADGSVAGRTPSPAPARAGSLRRP